MKTAPRDPRPVSAPMFRIEAAQTYQDHAEASFRRGYHQATCDIFSAMLAGADLNMLDFHVDVVEAWREDRSGKLGFCPPSMVDAMRREGKR